MAVATILALVAGIVALVVGREAVAAFCGYGAIALAILSLRDTR